MRALLRAIAWLSGTLTAVIILGGFGLFAAAHAGLYTFPAAADPNALSGTLVGAAIIFMGTMVGALILDV